MPLQSILGSGGSGSPYCTQSLTSGPAMGLTRQLLAWGLLRAQARAEYSGVTNFTPQVGWGKKPDFKLLLTDSR